MRGNRLILLIFVFCISDFQSILYSQEETLTLLTYYPAPYGIYRNLTTTQDTYLATNAGNVGIGTIAPGIISGSAKYLTIASIDAYQANNTSALEMRGSSIDATVPAAKIDFLHRGPSATDNIARIEARRGSSLGSAGDLLFYTNNSSTLSEKVRIQKDGRMGIGINDPLKLLTLGTNTTDNNVLRFYYQYPQYTGIYGDIYHGGNDEGFKIVAQTDSSGNAASGDIRFYTSSDQSAATEKIRITNAGNVGIGTTTPGIISGSTKYLTIASIDAYQANNTSALEMRGSSIDATVPVAKIDFLHRGLSATDNIARIEARRGSGLGSAGDLLFYTRSGAILSERVRIQSDGNVNMSTNSDPRMRIKSSTYSKEWEIGVGVVGRNVGAFFVKPVTTGDFDANQYPLSIDDVSGNVAIGNFYPDTDKLSVFGSFSATSKSFEITHPCDPNKVLRHSTLEGPENGVFYRGESRLLDGEVTIELPAYFEPLTLKENRTVLLTPIGEWSPIYVINGVKDGRFTVRTTEDGCPNQRFYWEVKAVRADVPPLEVEKEKIDNKL